MTQRKGLSDLFDATNLLSIKRRGIELGARLLSTTGILWISGNCYEPTRSHDKVLDLMRSCDIFCLPS
jgi:hypothetical protein